MIRRRPALPDLPGFARFCAGIPFAHPALPYIMSRANTHRSRSLSGEVENRNAPISVLVVSEDPALGSVCLETLEDAGYHVVCARHSGHALLECLSGRKPDVLVTELSMPDGSGPALARRLRRYFPDLRTVYVANAGTMLEATNVLIRPFSSAELLLRVRAESPAPPPSPSPTSSQAS